MKNNIKALREMKGETQLQLADYLGVTDACVCHWECGRNTPSSSQLIKLHQHFHVSTDCILGIEPIQTERS